MSQSSLASSHTSLVTVDEKDCFMHASAPDLTELPPHEYINENFPRELEVPERGSSLNPKRPDTLYPCPGILFADNFEKQDKIHQYFIPPNIVGETAYEPQTLQETPEGEETVVIKKQTTNVKKANWFKKWFCGVSDLLIITTVKVKVPKHCAVHCKKLSFNELRSIRGSKMYETHLLYNRNSLIKLERY